MNRVFRIIITFIIPLVFPGFGFSQIVNGIFNVPSYPIPAIYYTSQAPELPEKVMNHRLEYFPQYFYDQNGLPNCGQAAGVFNCMTYEFNRVLNRPADSSTIFAPTHSYNILCEGNGWYGVSAFNSWNLIMSQGNPTTNIYNEYSPYSTLGKTIDYRGYYRMQGYDNYEKSFKNRLSGYYSLNVANDEDLRILMHYFDDHLDGSNSGGTAIFYSNSYFMHSGLTPVIYDSVLCWPNGRTKVISYIAGNPSHSMTLVGYYNNTTIDFNGDGQITDSIDINNDNIVDFSDNEKILWIVINSYGDSWVNSMFLFKFDLLSKVWNKQVFIPVPYTAYNPQLTFKIRLNHTNRNSIKISAGISKDLNSDYPEKIIDFPIFNFQGGNHTMTGLDSISGAATLEFGIDISDILKHITNINNDFAKIFLKVENASCVAGSIDYCSLKSLIDGEEFELISTPYKLAAASTNYFSAILPVYSQGTDTVLQIVDIGKQIIFTNENFTKILQASGGSGNYNWQLLNTNEYTQEYIIEDESIPDDIIYNGTEDVAFSPDWKIPFGGKMWDSIYIGKNATISFTGNNTNPALYPYPPLLNSYYRDYEIDAISGHFFLKNISFTHQSDEEKIIVWFKDELETYIVCKTEIYRDGKIRLTYPSTNFGSEYSAGIKTGMSAYYSRFRKIGNSPTKNCVVFTPITATSGKSVSESGEISIAKQKNAGTSAFYVQLSDSNGHKTVKRIEVEFIESVNASEIFPNPSYDKAMIMLTSAENGKANFEIFNISGQLISQKKAEFWAGNSQVDISDLCTGLSPGLYHVRITLLSFSKLVRLVKL